MVARLDTPSFRDASDSVSASAALSSGLFDRPTDAAPTLTVPPSDSIYPTVSDQTASPMAFAGADWSAIKPVLDKASVINYSSAAENAAAGVEPDFIMGTDGQIKPNPKKTAPNPDGSINIQMEGLNNQDKIEALKSASENQKASIRELIRYFQKNNPNAQVPTEWLWQLEKQPDLPTPSSAPSRRDTPAPQQSFDPPPDSGPSRSSFRGGGSPGGGRTGGMPSFGGGPRGGSDASNFSRPERRPMFSTGRGDVPPPIAGDMEMRGGPTITPEKIDEVLRSFNSPAAGLGQVIYDEGVKRNINPAVALAFFVQESSAGTKGVAATTNSWGNIKGEGPAGSYKGFRAYDNFEQGVKDWYRLIDEKYLASRDQGGFGFTHLSQVISKYAPGSDNNNESKYVANVKGMVQGWAQDSAKPANA